MGTRIKIDSSCPACDLAAKQKRYGKWLRFFNGAYYVIQSVAYRPQEMPDAIFDGTPYKIVADYGEDGEHPQHNHHMGYERILDKEEDHEPIHSPDGDRAEREPEGLQAGGTGTA